MTTEQADQQTPTEADISAANEAVRRQNADLKRIAREFAGYHIWHSTDGSIYGTRLDQPSDHEVAAGMARTIGSNNVEGLIEQIHGQNALAKKIDARRQANGF